jgi:predicted RND superfamily exporter protein
MWIKVSRIILRSKFLLLGILLAITLFFGYHARHVEMSYEYASLLPQKDQAYRDNQEFLRIFGEEGNLIILGVEDPDFFDPLHFLRWQDLVSHLGAIDGVENVVSVSNAYDLVRDTLNRKFVARRIFSDEDMSPRKLDSLAARFRELPFYNNLVYNDPADTYLIAVTVNKDKMLNSHREALVRSIQRYGSHFEKESNLDLHYSGLPYIRVVTSMKIKKEIYLFSMLALLVCVCFLFLFFHSFKAVVIPLFIVLVQVVWSMGMMALFGYKITILTGMIPPLLIIIGMENSIYMLNKYNFEFSRYGNKIKALQRVIIRIGTATLMTNLTTASGFATLAVTKSEVLRQFGIIASLNIISLFVLTLILIPVIYTFVEPPSTRHLKYLESRFMTRIIDRLILVTKHHRKAVYAGTIILVVAGFIGISLMKSSGYIVDDIPRNDPIYTDLKFFETHFHGLMPLEVMIDTRKPNGVMQLSTLHKMEQLEEKLAGYQELSPPLSLLNLVKFARQAFYGGNPDYYTLPNNYEKNFILSYAMGGDAGLLHSFLDSSRQVARMSFRAKDVGTTRMEELYGRVTADIDSLFPAENFRVVPTGSSVTSFKGTNYLLHNLFTSLGLAIFLISLFMALLFSSSRMVVISLIPNLIPLVVTAAVMGYFGIPIKASTILVFSVAFGISVDSTIHFLTKYRLELKLTGWDIRRAVVYALRETGVSMIYTAAVLFFGFGIFALSSFGGTKAMGILVSLTLLVAVTSNLVLLPSLLSGMEELTQKESFEVPLIDVADEEGEVQKLEEENHNPV